MQAVLLSKICFRYLVGIKGFRQSAGCIRINFYQLIAAVGILYKVKTADIAHMIRVIRKNIRCELIRHIKQIKGHCAIIIGPQSLCQARQCCCKTCTDALQLTFIYIAHKQRADNRITVFPLRRIHIRHNIQINLIKPGIRLTIFIHLHHLRKLHCRWNGSCHCRYRFYRCFPYCQAWNFACFRQFPAAQ